MQSGRPVTGTDGSGSMGTRSVQSHRAPHLEGPFFYFMLCHHSLKLLTIFKGVLHLHSALGPTNYLAALGQTLGPKPALRGGDSPSILPPGGLLGPSCRRKQGGQQQGARPETPVSPTQNQV